MTTPPTTMPDWNALSAETFILEPGCWETCGGYCCSFDLPELAFQIIPHGKRQTILLLGQEYDHWRSAGHSPELLLGSPSPTEFRFDFGGPAPLRIVFLTCPLQGGCGRLPLKPLLCKLYPHLPVLDAAGNLEDVIDGSVFELTLSALDMPHRCTLVSRREAYRRQWKDSPETLAPLAFPYYMFYSQAAAEFVRFMTAALRSREDLKAKSGRDFWQFWELLYLSRQLVDASGLRAAIKARFDALCDVHGTQWYDEPPTRQA